MSVAAIAIIVFRTRRGNIIAPVVDCRELADSNDDNPYTTLVALEPDFDENRRLTRANRVL